MFCCYINLHYSECKQYKWPVVSDKGACHSVGLTIKAEHLKVQYLTKGVGRTTPLCPCGENTVNLYQNFIFRTDSMARAVSIFIYMHCIITF